MAFAILKQLNFAYFLICLFATIGLSIYSCYRFAKNEDVTLVQESKFLSSRDAVYPSFSFCILPPFMENKFQSYGDSRINMTSYVNFLKGEFWDDRFLKIEYDNVTVSLTDNLVAGKSFTESWKESDWNPEHYVSFRSPNRKCFTVDAPFVDKNALFSYATAIKNDVFPDGERPPYGYTTYLHYPGQRFTGLYTIKYDFVSRHNKSNPYLMEYRVRNIGVISRRNKRYDPCIEDWRHYDQQFMEQKMNEIGCHPPHWQTTSDLPTCTNANHMKKFSRHPTNTEIEVFAPPCKVINRLDYSYDENDEKDDVIRWHLTRPEG